MDRERAASLSEQVMLDFIQMQAFREDPLVIDDANGVRVRDIDGKRYIDGMSGIFVVNLGHGRTEIIDAMSDQLRKVAFVPQLGTSVPELELADLLVQMTPPRYTRVKFFSGGSETTEAAIKMSRQYHKQTGNPGKFKVMSHNRGYHGATGFALAATGWPHLRGPFEPYAPGFLRMLTPDSYHPLFNVPPDELCATYLRLVEETIQMEGPDTIAAIIIEPVLMSAGIIVPPAGYLAGLRAIADRYNITFIIDEVITGFGRTGKLFCWQHSDAEPDLFCCGKGMSGGYAPLSALIISDHIGKAFWGEGPDKVQFHAGHTFAGNPVACAAGLAALRFMTESGALDNGAEVGAYLRNRLVALAADHETIGDVRGMGMMLGLEFVTSRDTRERFADSVNFGLRLQAEARTRGLLLRSSAWFTAIAPPLTTTEAEADEIVAILDASLYAVEASLGLARQAVGAAR